VKYRMFGSKGPLFAPAGDGNGGGGAPPNVNEWNQFLAWKQQQSASSAAAPTANAGTPAPQAAVSMTDVIAQTVAATVKAMQPQPVAQPQYPPTAAPPSAAGNRVNAVTSGGLVDFWHMDHHQLDELGGDGIRQAFEKHIEVGRRRSGAPQVPAVVRKKGNNP
jgi:hypothetical protein